MSQPKEKEIIYVRESALQSILADAFMFGGILGLLYFNHRILNGSSFVDFVFILMMLFIAVGRMQSKYKRFNTLGDLKKWLEEQSNE